MRYRDLTIGMFLALSLALAGCGSPAASPEATSLEITELPAATVATTTGAASATEEPTATAESPKNILQLGELQLVPFAPTWFLNESQLASIVFVEEDSLRIDGPAYPFNVEIEIEENKERKINFFGALTLESHADFDITASFDKEGGGCPETDTSGSMDTGGEGGDVACVNLMTSDCIVFGYMDSDNFQAFCISDPWWFLKSYGDGVTFDSTSILTSDAIRDMGRILYGEHPEPNELRLKMKDNILYGFINGQQIFERFGMGLVEGDGEGCDYTYPMDYEQWDWWYDPFNCVELIGKIGVGCDYIQDQIYLYEGDWQVANCDVTVTINP